MKKSRKSLMLLPLLAICLSGCYTIVPEDAPEVSEDEFTPEGSYSVPEEDTSESSSIPYESTSGTDESTGGDSSSTPSETPGEGSSSDSSKPSEPSDPTNPSESGSSSSSTPSETHEYSYSLQITNKDNFTNIYIDEDNPENNTYIEDYSLQINLYTLTDDVITNTEVATINDVSITSSDESVVALDGLTLIPQNKSGSATISVYWLDHSEAVDALTCAVTYKAHQIVTSYEYELVINNKETLLNEVWTTADTPREISVSVLKSTLKDGELDSIDELENPNVRLTQENLTEGETNEILLIDGLSVTPKNPGSVRLTASWIEGEDQAEDYFDIIVSEAYYEGDYNLTITDPETFGGTDTNPWYIGTSRELDVTLSYSDYAYSDDNLYNTYEIKASIDDVTISVYGVTDSEVVARADDDLTWYSQNGEIMLSPVGANYDHYLVVVAWNIHPEATDYVYVHTEVPETTYAMTITNAEDIASEWKYDDSKTRTLKYEITQTTQGETTITDKDLYKESILAWTYPSGYVSATVQEDGESITLELLKEPIDDFTVTVYVMWSEHTSAIGYVELDLYQYTYDISITNAEYLSASWSLEDNETRDVEYKVTKDNTQISELGTSYVEIASSDTELASVDGTKVSAVSVGNPTISATLYNEDGVVLATDIVLLSIDDVVKATSVSLTESSIEFTNLSDTKEISATVYGLNNREATDQTVTWEVDNNGIVLTGEGNTITIGVTGYNISGTLTCKSANGVGVATCSVTIGEEPGTPVTIHNFEYSSLVIPNPDDEGVYVLGVNNGSDAYLKSDSGFSVVDDYAEASAIRVIPDEGGYYLQVGDQYVTNSSGTFGLGNDGTKVSIDGNGTISDGSYVLCLDSNSLPTWSSSGTQLYLLDKAMGNSSTYTSQTGQGLVFAAEDSSGVLHYFDGSISSGRGGTTTDLSEATQMMIEFIGSNNYYLRYGDNYANYLYISADSTSGVAQTTSSSTSNVALRYDSSKDYWQANSGISERHFAFYSSNNDIRPYGASDSNPYFQLYDYDSPDVKGITATVDDYELTEGYETDLHIKTYPTCANAVTTSHINVSSTGTGSITYNNGSIRGADVGETTVTVTYTDNTSIYHSFDMEILQDEVAHEEVNLGTYDFSKNSGKSTSALSGSELETIFNSCWVSSSLTNSPLKSINSTSNIYEYYTSGGLYSSTTGLLKTGTGSATGVIDMSMNYTITKLVFDQQSWSTSENCTITVNGIGKQSTSKGVQEQLTFDFVNDASGQGASNSVSITCDKRCYIFNIIVYGYLI